MVNELLSCEDSGAYRAAAMAEALGWWDDDFQGARLTDAAAFAAVEMAIAERAAAVGATGQITTSPSGGSFYCISRPVVERLQAMRDRIVELAASFANLDPGTDEHCNGYVNSIPNWTRDDIARSEHPMSGIPMAGELDQSPGQNARIGAFLADCKYWLCKLRKVDATDLAWYSRCHEANAYHSVWVEEGLPAHNIPADGGETINGADMGTPSSVASRLAQAIAGAATFSDDAPGAGDAARWPAATSVSTYHIGRTESSATDYEYAYSYGGWKWSCSRRGLSESASAAVYSGLNVRNPAAIPAKAVVLMVPGARPSTTVDDLSFSVHDDTYHYDATETYEVYSRVFQGRAFVEMALYNGSEVQTLSDSWGASGDGTRTRAYCRPDGTAYQTETTATTGNSTSTSGYAREVEAGRLLELPDLAQTPDVVVAGGATALGVIPALSSLPVPSASSPVPLPSLGKNSLNDYSLDINYSVRARVLLDYGYFYAFGDAQ